ncbi:iron ABC transporter permease [Alphaproteobacteria bacterium KMM 3653]|uniref:Iron ABC transporter permease n=1 Tax=Harenicola maris TaxID=2841044 RepID=A0AAP2G580_9RHOB|nr:iron ABC transporter permease [Harenicola maris]
MADKLTQAYDGGFRLRRIFGWPLVTLCVAGLVLLPIAAVLWLAAFPEAPIWGHLWNTTLPRYLRNTAILALGVGLICACVGTGAAWLVTVYRFPGRGWLQWALFLPLAVPAYVGAYALVDLFEYAGPVQTGLRGLMGYTNAQDYSFPQIRSRGGAIIVIAASLFPYVYLLARAAFREQSGRMLEVARALGAGPLARFWRVGVPLARPAIVAGSAIVMMETVADFGVVDFFAVQTLTTGIFSQWLEGGNPGGAAQIACLILLVVAVLVSLERFARRGSRYHRAGQSTQQVVPEDLKGLAGWLAFAACLLPFAIGFCLPAGVMAYHSIAEVDSWLAPGLTRAALNTVITGASASVLTVMSALALVYGAKLAKGRAAARILPLTTIGYAAPGAVLGLGVLIPLAAFDNALADTVLAVTGWDPGLILTGGAAALVYAYCVRFFAIGQGAVEGALGRIAPSLPMAARTLGQGPTQTLRRVYLPLIRGSVGTALLLVFVDCVKELPATLLLRPFNYNTLATRVYEQASLERLTEAAPAALIVTTVGLFAVILLARANR